MMCPEGTIYVPQRRDPNYLDCWILDIPVKIAHFIGSHWLLCGHEIPSARDRDFVTDHLPDGYTVCSWCIVADMAQ